MKEELMLVHKELATGSPEGMEVARRILYLLRKGSIVLGLGDIDWQLESLLEGMGVHIRYSRNGYSATARIR